MPIYEYTCKDCTKKFEKLVFNQTTLISCPDCGSGEVEKLFSAFGFKSSSGFTSSSGKQGCDSCATHNCSHCH